MADNLWARLTFQTDDPDNKPNISKHQFFAVLREFVRGQFTAGDIRTHYNVDAGDPGAAELLGLINAEPTTQDKLNKVRELEDLFYIHENLETNALYPDKAALMTRLGL